MDNNIKFKLLTTKDVGEILSTKESTVRTWVRRGIIPKSVQIKLGSSLRFNKDKLLEWIADNECV